MDYSGYIQHDVTLGTFSERPHPASSSGTLDVDCLFGGESEDSGLSIFQLASQRVYREAMDIMVGLYARHLGGLVRYSPSRLWDAKPEEIATVYRLLTLDCSPEPIRFRNGIFFGLDDSELERFLWEMKLVEPFWDYVYASDELDQIWQEATSGFGMSYLGLEANMQAVESIAGRELMEAIFAGVPAEDVLA